MRVERTSLLILVLICWIAALCCADERVPLGVEFTSPDSRYSVHLEELGGLTYFVIKDRQTQRLNHSIIMPTAVLYLHWASDSNSFVTVEHISKGSYGRVIYRDKLKWKNVEVKPPYEGTMDSSVIGLQLGSEMVHYKFAVTKLTADWKPFNYWFCDVNVQLKTGKVINVKWTPISESELSASLWPHLPIYIPPMVYQ